MHTVCAEMSQAFLDFSARQGNDLMTPVEAFGFPGLKAGDYWCVCLGRWMEALEADVAPRVFLAATHASVLEFIDREVLERHAVR